jgi:shikimate kinase
VVKSTSENAPKKPITKEKSKPKQRSARSGASALARKTVAHEAKPRAAILIGFMGAGKSSVGRALADLLGWAFEDLDERIERREQRRIADIFRDSGETEFRRAEHASLKEVLHELTAGAEKIVALGGGAFVEKQNAKLIKKAGVPAVFLDAAPEELWQRCRRQALQQGTKRPLLGSWKSFQHLYESRRPHYLKAAFRHETNGMTVEMIAFELMQKLGLKPRLTKRGKKQ